MEKEIKGIILAGGMATRLFPSTIVVSKQLLPVYDRPMIFYPLNTLIKGGVRDILIIVSPEHSGSFINLLGSIFRNHGVKISFCVQRQPRGLPEAFILGENHIDQNHVALILGDNIFEDDFSQEIKNFSGGGQVFVKRVPDPERFGVVKLNEAGQPEMVIEKPKEWVSDYAITGLYLFDCRVVAASKALQPSVRGELEITDLHKFYMNNRELKVTVFDGAWLDAGTHDSLLEATLAVKEKGIIKNFHPIIEEALQELCLDYKNSIKKF